MCIQSASEKAESCNVRGEEMPLETRAAGELLYTFSLYHSENNSTTVSFFGGEGNRDQHREAEREALELLPLPLT